MDNNIERREFLKKISTLGLGMGLVGAGAPRVFAGGSPNKKIVVGVMGTNSRGAALAEGFARLPGAEVAYICDVDEKAMANGIKAVEEGGQKKKPKGVKDFRRILDDKALDALVIGAPDHWHAPAAILALKAGKHVYVEKPCSHNPHEGELLVKAAKKYDKVVQMGNQRRSWPNVIQGINEIKDGAIGETYFARAWYANTREPIGHGKKTSVPSGLDFDLWQGPAPRMEYQDNLLHYNWHWFWHWGTGELLNNGTHFIDLCRWGLEVDYPLQVSSNGGRYAYDDDWETPDTQTASYDFEGGKTISWEGRSCNGQPIGGHGVGASFHGTEGTIVIHPGNGYTLFDNNGNEVKEVSMDSNNELDTTGPGYDRDAVHFTNFTDAIRSSDSSNLNSPVEDGNKSVLLCQLGNIAYRTGRTLDCDPDTGKIVDDKEAMKLWKREYEPGWEPTV
ncbi:Predicted dehydrogenase [Fodinibius roseus]|uniref:Predicted dehydrogenase n=1 Tax=Fodinibius roseus TaxID=1194090 RepID=A0A1M5L2M7_9BACT|nr:Gfo/Idh/MocA family oxidoreductase [Fodinibius roseus]SHG59241.1 Predicted dehydrogenase [Fodinibius roseus]